MAQKKIVLLASLLLATTALAQTADSRTAIDRKDNLSIDVLPQQVVLARCAYSGTEEGCPNTLLPSDPEANRTLAQMPRRMGPMAGRQGPPMRQAAYPETWGPQFSPGHALIGAAIGFGFGAAAGSKNGVRSSLAVGTLVGLLGAGIGAGIPSFPSHFRRRGWDDQEASRRKPKRSKPDLSQPDSATQVAASRLEPTETYQKNDFSGRRGTPNPSRRISYLDSAPGWLPMVTNPVRGSLRG
jgi:hypothetical protein